jgi:2-methylcitrate dehydratase PrpD
VVAGKIQGFTAAQIATALGIAGSQSSGSAQWIEEGSWTKRMHPGWASHSGIIAAKLAQKGFNAPKKIFEGGKGIYGSYLREGDFVLDRIAEGLGDKWETREICFKIYPSGYWTYLFIDAALHLRKQHNIDTEDIVEITCTTSPGQVKRNFDPKEIKYSPPNGYASISSIPYTVAAALVEGQFTLKEVSDDKVKDPQILKTAKKVKRGVNPDFIDYRNALVNIKLKDGKSYERYLEDAIGSPEMPVSREIIEGKFRTNAENVLSEGKIQAVIDMVDTLDKLEDISGLMRLLKSK